MKNKFLNSSIALTAIVLLVTACASGPRLPESLEDRAADRVAAILANDYERAYWYLSPGFRQLTDLETYTEQQEKRPVRWRHAEVDRVDNCDEDHCQVYTRVFFRVKSPVQGGGIVDSVQVIKEDWISTPEGWFLVPET